MLFSKKSFRQFFSGRPSRRRTACPIPAQLETLQSKVLLSAAPVEPETTEEPVSEEPVSEEPVSEEPVSEEPVSEEPVTEDTSSNPPTTSESAGGPWFESVSAVIGIGETTVTGTVYSSDGNMSSFSVSFGGVLAGYSVPVNSDGSFTLTIYTEISGSAYAQLLDNTATEVDRVDFYV